MDQGNKQIKRKRRCEQYKLVTSNDVITLGKPVRSITAERVPAVKKSIEPLLKPPAIHDIILKIAEESDSNVFKTKLDRLVCQVINPSGAVSPEICENLIFLLLQLNVIARKCSLLLICSLVESVSMILATITTRTDARLAILPAVASIHIALDRRIDDRPVPIELVKCYVQDKMLANPQWTNLVESRTVCRWVVTNCLNGHQAFRINDKTCKIEYVDCGPRRSTYDEVSVCEQIFSSRADKQRIVASKEGITPDQFKLMADCTVLYSVRKHLTFYKLESWLQDPKLSKIAMELLAGVIVNGRHGQDDEGKTNVINHILQFQLKSSLIHQIILPAIHVLIIQDEMFRLENIKMYAKQCILFLVRNCRTRNIAMSVLYALLDIDVSNSSLFIGEGLVQSLSEQPHETELQMCCSILKELCLPLKGTQICAEMVQKGLTDYTGGTHNVPHLTARIMDLNQVLVVLEIIQKLRSDNTALLRPTVLRWQMNCLNFLYQEQWPGHAQDYQRLVSSCFFFNTDLDPVSTILASLTTENERITAIQSIQSAGTNEQIMVQLLKIGSNQHLPFDRVSMLEMVEQIVRRTAYYAEYGATLSIQNMNLILQEIRNCCLVDNGRLDSACFWRSCFIFTFIVCLTDAEKDVMDIVVRMPTVRVMIEMLLTGQYVHIPDTVALRLSAQTETVPIEELSSEEYYSEDFCDKWPCSLTPIHIGKLKALNHSYRLSNRLLSNHRSLIEFIFSELLAYRSKNPTLFDKIFTNWAHILNGHLNLEQLVPLECLCRYVLNGGSNDTVKSIERILIDKISKCDQARFEVLKFFVNELRESMFETRRYVWKKLEDFLLGERLWPANSPADAELVMNAVKALSMESDVRRACLLLDLIMTMKEDDVGDVCSCLAKSMEERPKFWKYLLQANAELKTTVCQTLKTNLSQHKFEHLVMPAVLSEPQDDLDNVLALKTVIKKVITIGQESLGVNDVDIRFLRGDIDLRSTPGEGDNAEVKIFDLIAASVTNKISIDDFTAELCRLDDKLVFEALTQFTKSKEAGEWLLAKLQMPENRIVKYLLAQKTNKFKHVSILCNLNDSIIAERRPNPQERICVKRDLDEKDRIFTAAKAQMTVIFLLKSMDAKSDIQTIKEITQYLYVQATQNDLIASSIVPLIQCIAKDRRYRRIVTDQNVLHVFEKLKNIGSRVPFPMDRIRADRYCKPAETDHRDTEKCYSLCRRLQGWMYDGENITQPNRIRLIKSALSTILPSLLQSARNSVAVNVANAIFKVSFDPTTLSQLTNAIAPILGFYPNLS